MDAYGEASRTVNLDSNIRIMNVNIIEHSKREQLYQLCENSNEQADN